MPVSLRLPPDIKERLDRLAEKTGRTKTYYMIEAIKQHIEDMEDLYMAEQSLLAVREGRSKTYSLEEVEHALGLMDRA